MRDNAAKICDRKEPAKPRDIRQSSLESTESAKVLGQELLMGDE